MGQEIHQLLAELMSKDWVVTFRPGYCCYGEEKIPTWFIFAENGNQSLTFQGRMQPESYINSEDIMEERSPNIDEMNRLWIQLSLTKILDESPAGFLKGKGKGKGNEWETMDQ